MIYRPPAKPDPWADRIAGIAALRGMLGESTIKESSSIGLTTRVTMPLLQAASIGLSFVVFAAGGWALVDGLVGAFDIDLNPGMYLLTLVTIGTLVIGLWVGANRAFEKSRAAVRWAFVLASALFVVSALLSAAFEFQRAFDWMRFAEILFGAGAVLASALLLFHQILNIVDPYWRTSPAERELLAMWRSQPGQISDQRFAQRIPYRHAGRSERILAEPQTADLHPDPFEYEVLDFLKMSREIGLGIRDWARGTVQVLESTKVKVTETKWAAIVDRLIEDGYVLSGGHGFPTRWAEGWDAESVYAEECRRFEHAWSNTLKMNKMTRENA